MKLHLVNAAGGTHLSTADGRIVAGSEGQRVDLGGARLLPGLINAHDHLHLNARCRA